MADYLVLTWLRGFERDAAAAIASLERGGWTEPYRCSECRGFVRGCRPPAVKAFAGGLLIGAAFDRAATEAGRAGPFEPAQLSGLSPPKAGAALTRKAWGGYVALFFQSGTAPAVVRDPLGGLECVRWRRGPLHFVASTVPDEGALTPLEFAIDWRSVAAILRDSSVASALVALAGVDSVAPGTLSFPDRQFRLWSPATVARRPVRHRPADLERRLDAVTRALTLDRVAVTAEISGGLDSAIVALGLGATGAPMVAALNQATAEAEGDERLYAQAVADRIGAPLDVMHRGVFSFDVAALAAAAAGPRPPYNAQDPAYDRFASAWLTKVGADALFTGQGGDVVFFQMPEPVVAGDILLDVLRGRCNLQALAQWAHRCRSSTWRIMAEAIGAIGGGEGAIPPPEFMGRLFPRHAVHPWLDDLGGLSPGKRYQIWTLTSVGGRVGPSLRGDVADLVHPLLAQPIVEMCLETPLSSLAVGERDRPFARKAFAERLPAVLLQRRGKGDVTKLYSRSVAASLEVVAPLLLDGRLVQQGVIDRETLAPLLDPEVMMWRNLAGPIMRAVYLEVWVRAWEARLATRSAAAG